MHLVPFITDASIKVDTWIRVIVVAKIERFRVDTIAARVNTCSTRCVTLSPILFYSIRLHKESIDNKFATISQATIPRRMANFKRSPQCQHNKRIDSVHIFFVIVSLARSLVRPLLFTRSVRKMWAHGNEKSKSFCKWITNGITFWMHEQLSNRYASKNGRESFFYSDSCFSSFYSVSLSHNLTLSRSFFPSLSLLQSGRVSSQHSTMYLG